MPLGRKIGSLESGLGMMAAGNDVVPEKNSIVVKIQHERLSPKQRGHGVINAKPPAIWGLA